MTSIPESIKHFNAGRNPLPLALKYQAMRSDLFAFYRGCCHVFYQQLQQSSCLYASPPTWVCGDLHLENFGSYKAGNGIMYMNINDFDESLLAPALFDVARVMTSILLAKNSLKVDDLGALQLCKRFLKVYIQTLLSATAQLVDDRLAHGNVQDFLLQTHLQKRKEFLKARTVKTAEQLTLLLDNKKVFAIDADIKKQIIKAVAQWAKIQPQADFYRVLDVGARIAGVSSLGVQRYVLLINGNGKNNPYLLDMKIANPSCLTPFVTTPQPAWTSQAQRIIQVQKRIQIYPPALLNSVPFKQQTFVIKELQPWAAKLDFASYKGKQDKLNTAISTFANITAWSHLHSSGRDNSATADELVAFARAAATWKAELLSEVKLYADIMQHNYRAYCKAYDKGYFKL